MAFLLQTRVNVLYGRDHGVTSKNKRVDVPPVPVPSLPGLVTVTGTDPGELIRYAGTDTVMLVAVGVAIGTNRDV